MAIQTKRERARFSRLCQELRQLVGQVVRLSQTLLSDKPLMRGTLYELRRKCGKPACKCGAGHLHSTMVVVTSEEGRKKLRVVAKGDLVETKIKTDRYRKLRRARAELVKLIGQIVRVIDQMEALRREEKK